MNDRALSAAIERLYRRVLLTVGRGRITTGTDAGYAQKHQVQLGADEIRDNTIRIPEYGFTSMPLPGCNAVVLFVAGDRSNGVIIGTDDPRYRPHNLQPGEAMIYDALGRSIYLSAAGIVVNGGGSPLTINNAPMVTFDTPSVSTTGNLTVGSGASGTFTATGGVNVTVRDGIITNIY